MNRLDVRSAQRALLIAGALLCTSTPAGAADAQWLGVWTNPQRSVQVRAHRCGQAMCGTVIQASEKARDDARKGGVDKLVGARLFSDFVAEEYNVWRGKVFVPDIGATLSGTITLVNQRTLNAEGCLIGRIGCRSQVWTRVEK